MQLINNPFFAIHQVFAVLKNALKFKDVSAVSLVAPFLMRCAKGFVAKRIWGCPGFPLLRWEKGSGTRFGGGEKGLRLPRSLGWSMRKKGVSDPFLHRKRESQTLFPTAKGNPVHPQIPLATNPFFRPLIYYYRGIFREIQSHLQTLSRF